MSKHLCNVRVKLMSYNSFGLNQLFLAGEDGAPRCQVIDLEELRKIHPVLFGDDIRRIPLLNKVGLSIPGF